MINQSKHIRHHDAADTLMAQTAFKVEEESISIHNLGNASQLSSAQLNTETDSSPTASQLVHNSYFFSEPSDTTDTPYLSPYEKRIPTEDEPYQFSDSYHLSHYPWLPIIAEEALLDGTRAATSPEELYWAETSFASNLPDSSICPTASLPRDTTDGQLSPLPGCDGKVPTKSEKRGTHDEAAEDRGSKRRKSSTDDQQADIEEQRRVRRIIRNLEHFEKEQKLYVKQQLRAIKDSIT